MHGLRVVDHGRDAGVGEPRLERVTTNALRHTDGVLGPRAYVPVPHDGQAERRSRQQVGVPAGALIDGIEFEIPESMEFGKQNGRLDSIKPAVHAEAHVVVLHGALTVNGDTADQLRPFIAVSEHGAAVAVAAEGFRGEEARRGDVSERACPSTVDGATKALGTVLQKPEALLFANGAYLTVVSRLAEQVNRNDRLGHEPALTGEATGRGDLPRVDVERVLQDVHEDRGGAHRGDDLAGREEREVRDDHGVAGADAPGEEGELQCVGPVGAGDAVLRVDVSGELSLELRDRLAADESSGGDDLGDAGIDLLPQRRILGLQVSKFHDYPISSRPTAVFS